MRKTKKKLILIGGLCVTVVTTIILVLTLVCFHDWQDATCITPITCSKCGKTEGEPLSHKWLKATCTTPKTCRVCKEKVGFALGHTEGEWKTVSNNMVEATVTSQKYCTVCNIELDEQTTSLKQLYFGSEFMATPVEFTRRLNNMLNKIAGNTLTAHSGSSLDEYACAIYDGNKRVGIILFANSDGIVTVDQKDESGFTSVLGKADNAEVYGDTMIALVLAADPSLDFESAKAIALRTTKYGYWPKNGIAYSVEFPSSGAVFSMSIDN